MKRALFIKLTSMGDLLHALPAMTDAVTKIPSLSFDWVIDTHFSEIALWHPAVKKIIPTDHRSWRKKPCQSLKHNQIQNFLKSIRSEQYDFVIDGQSSLKSAITTRLARGPKHGLDKTSARESLAHLAYQHKYSVDKKMHAIKRLRLLFSQVFHYPFIETPVNYGIVNYPFSPLKFELPKPYLVFVHNASWENKLWAETNWQQLITLAAKEKQHVVLPWGNQKEKNRAERIKANFANVTILPFCSLSEHARILKESDGAICSDTGLSHLAAALNVPAVTMYGPTSRELIGTHGLHQQHLVPSFPCIQCYKHHCRFDNKLQSEPLCLTAIAPEMVWKIFRDLKMSYS